MKVDDEQPAALNPLEEWLQADPARSQGKLAKQIGCTQGAVSQWIKKGCVPPRRCRAVSRITGIPAARLNPEMFGPSDQSGAACS